MTHAPDRQLNAGEGRFGRLMGRVFDTFFVLAITVGVALWIAYYVKFN